MDNETIKKMIKQYLAIDDELSELNKHTKEVRKAKTDLEDNIKTFMLENSIAKVDIGAGTLRISKSKAHKKLNKKTILEALLSSLEEEKAHDIIEGIFNDDDEEEVTKLERSKKPKKS